ncbi:MAG TPA: 2-C-methyl-D-erythritol 4-phosphate cytidylyltransferase [Steroidobacteraceae bacterium]|nr:2-C-methyl-D-erythritol 4-phosphate cytidylyltransferase [Steroidobacteraceae bacterium]
MRYWLIVPAAGVGRRFGEQTPKQYVPLHGRTLLEWSLAPFRADSRCTGIVVALAAGDPHWPAIARKLGNVTVAPGGAERSHSVRNGLAALQGQVAASDWVLVHDAARPCLPAADLNRLVERLDSHPVGGLLAAPAADTLKATGEDLQVVRTVDRSGLWRALTPQMFRYGRLCEALDAALASGRLPTDESQAIEWLGDHPQIVAGSAANLKVTSPEDLLVAAALLQETRA